MVSAKEIAASIEAKKKKPPGAAEEGSPEEEASEPADEAAAEGDAGSEPDDELGDYDAIEDSAVSDIMTSKDPATVKAALRQFVRACMDRGEEE